MSKYTSTVKLIINGVQYNIHKYVLVNLPFFEDFVKDDTQTELVIDIDFDNKLIELFIDYLYSNIKSLDNIIDYYDFFKITDFFCVTITNKYFNNGQIKYLYNYCCDKKEIDMFLKFIEFINIEIDITMFTDNFDIELIKKLINSISFLNLYWNYKNFTQKQFTDILRHCNVTFNNKFGIDSYCELEEIFYITILNFLKEDNRNIELNTNIIKSLFEKDDVGFLKSLGEEIKGTNALEYLYKQYC